MRWRTGTARTVERTWSATVEDHIAEHTNHTAQKYNVMTTAQNTLNDYFFAPMRHNSVHLRCALCWVNLQLRQRGRPRRRPWTPSRPRLPSSAAAATVPLLQAWFFFPSTRKLKKKRERERGGVLCGVFRGSASACYSARRVYLR